MNNNNNNNSEKNVNDKYFKRVTINDEVHDQELLIKTKKTARYKENYFTLFQGEFMDKKIKLGVIKEGLGSKTLLLFYLMNEMDSSNSVRKSKKEIAKELGIDQQMLSKQLKVLIDMELIRNENHHIVFNQYFVNKGQVKNHPNIIR